jgi:aminodeoxyfutalosine deaminase
MPTSKTDAPRIIRATWIAPMSGPLLRDAAIAIGRGKILAIGNPMQVIASYPLARVTKFDDTILLPGFVNAHCHLELSDMTAGDRPASFVDWLINVIKSRVLVDPDMLKEVVTFAVRAGVEECLRYGVTTVADVSRQCIMTRRLLKDGPLRVISFGEVQGMAARRHMLSERLAVAVDPALASESCHIGVSPHAPYSIEPDGYRRCVADAVSRNLPLTTHLAESPDEREFLATHTGPLKKLWDFLNFWDDQVPKFEGGPIRYARALGLLDIPSILAHVNYCDDDELDILAHGKASVVYCPRTHAYFGHPPHRFRDMQNRGMSVAVGTDSCASSPNLNLLDDMRLVQSLAPEIAPEKIFAMGTIDAAKAIGLATIAGSLDIGKSADFTTFSVTSDHPLTEILEAGATPDQVWIAGQKMTLSIDQVQDI